MSINKNILDIEIDDEDDVDLYNDKLDDSSSKNEEDTLANIQSLASQILSSEIDDDEYEDEDDLDDEDIKDDESIEVIDEQENKSFSTNESNNEDNELLIQANKIINSSSENITNDSNTIEDKLEIEKKLFGSYQINYQNKKNKPTEKYTKLEEDSKIDSSKFPDNEVTIEKVRSKINQYENERHEIQKFLEFSNKTMKISEARSLIEACLFVLGSEGLNAYDIKKVTELPLAIIHNILDEMMDYYSKNINSGIYLVQYGNKYKFVSKKEHFNKIGLVLNKKERKPLSDSVLETLAVIAYNQPCTKSTIENIRQKNCFNAIQRLEQIGLIEANERSDAIGKPWLYTLTQKFFDTYGIKSLTELPPINRGDKNYQVNETESEDIESSIIDDGIIE
ncbi:MAG: SMC-Scp complex subunit ScpB [Ureaplasma sp.]|nr:SMC-Scp complex subunit ScpB [Ureaplasma sp.]MDE7221895.1 SMC-Scp complex subunit ScpB [Ureaplasma sp.]